jgi:hypothetical protein
MTDTGVGRRHVLVEQDLIGLARLREVLSDRGWQVMPDDETAWLWPSRQPADGTRLLRAGASIYFDEEDPEEGYIVEGPLARDESTPLLRYLTVDELIGALDRIEAWSYSQQAVDIDEGHLRRFG